MATKKHKPTAAQRAQGASKKKRDRAAARRRQAFGDLRDQQKYRLAGSVGNYDAPPPPPSALDKLTLDEFLALQRERIQACSGHQP